jgi:hypothetical protein
LWLFKKNLEEERDEKPPPLKLGVFSVPFSLIIIVIKGQL